MTILMTPETVIGMSVSSISCGQHLSSGYWCGTLREELWVIEPGLRPTVYSINGHESMGVWMGPHTTAALEASTESNKSIK